MQDVAQRPQVLVGESLQLLLGQLHGWSPGGGGRQPTTTVPVMNGWNEQMYENVPALSKVTDADVQKPAEALREARKGHETRIVFVEKDGLSGDELELNQLELELP